jgi:hypothetical protein
MFYERMDYAIISGNEQGTVDNGTPGAGGHIQTFSAERTKA